MNSQIKKALAISNHGDTVIVYAGIYKEGNIAVKKAIYLIGKNLPVLDGEFEHEILTIKSDGVTVKGFHIMNSGKTTMSDPSGIRIYDVKNIVIEGNTLTNNFFGIYLQRTKNCLLKNNIIKSSEEKENRSGNGIHCWKADSIQVIGNRIEGHRDGVYFEFVTVLVVE